MTAGTGTIFDEPSNGTSLARAAKLASGDSVSGAPNLQICTGPPHEPAC